jgi:hypothetical protein
MEQRLRYSWLRTCLTPFSVGPNQVISHTITVGYVLVLDGMPKWAVLSPPGMWPTASHEMSSAVLAERGANVGHS